MPSEQGIDGLAAAASAGGGFASVLLIGRWLLNWLTGRVDHRQAVLDAQDQKVDLEWQKIREEQKEEIRKLQLRVDKFEAQGRAMRLAFEHVAAGLIRLDPQHPALAIADRILAQIFPIDMTIAVERAEAALDARPDQPKD